MTDVSESRIKRLSSDQLRALGAEPQNEVSFYTRPAITDGIYLAMMHAMGKKPSATAIGVYSDN